MSNALPFVIGSQTSESAAERAKDGAGTQHAVMHRYVPINIRFMRHTKQDDGCWIWDGAKGSAGYGLLAHAGEEKAHRVSWVLHHGPIPAGLCVCHRCDVPSCVNPDHLFLGTVGDNNRDRHAKGRTKISFNPATRYPERLARGERQGSAKLKPDNVIEIIRSYRSGVSQEALAIKFNVAQTTVGRIVRRKLWRHIEVPE